MTATARFLQVIVLAGAPEIARAVADNLSLKRGLYRIVLTEDDLRGFDPARLVVIVHHTHSSSLDTALAYYIELGAVVLTV